jgi:S-DNA-T family DNA segregation ATPase FtsK/SpoIIIE
MAKKISKGVANNATDAVNKKSSLKIGRRQKFIVGILFIFFSLALLLSFISYFITGYADQSSVSQLTNRALSTENWLGKIGAFLADFFLYQGFGVTSFLLVRVLFLIGAYLVLDMSLLKLKKNFFWDGFLIIIGSILLGFLWDYVPQLGGVIGYEMNLFIQDYIGKTGTLLVLLFGVLIFLVFKINVSPDTFTSIFEKSAKSFNADLASETSANPIIDANHSEDQNSTEDELPIVPLPNEEDDFLLTEDEEEISNIELKTYPNSFEINKEALKPTISNSSELNLDPKLKSETPEVTNFSIEDRSIPNEPFINEDAFVIEKVEEEVLVEENLSARLVQDFGEFDPTLELSNYQFPPIDLLKEYSTGGITINQAELEENKNKIVDTLKNYSIGISQIKATVGPTVTLYEIVPDAGVRISKIKNLEDDIALSLSALGIRIIAQFQEKELLV